MCGRCGQERHTGLVERLTSRPDCGPQRQPGSGASPKQLAASRKCQPRPEEPLPLTIHRAVMASYYLYLAGEDRAHFGFTHDPYLTAHCWPAEAILAPCRSPAPAH